MLNDFQWIEEVFDAGGHGEGGSRHLEMTPDPSEVTYLVIPGNEDTFLLGRNVTGNPGLKLLPNKGKITSILDAVSEAERWWESRQVCSFHIASSGGQT